MLKLLIDIDMTCYYNLYKYVYTITFKVSYFFENVVKCIIMSALSIVSIILKQYSPILTSSRFTNCNCAEITHNNATSRNSQRRELNVRSKCLTYTRVSMIDMSTGASATRGKQTLIMGLAWGGWLTAITKIDFTLRVPPSTILRHGDAPFERVDVHGTLRKTSDTPLSHRHTPVKPRYPHVPGKTSV